METEKYRRMTLDPDFKGAVLDYRMMVLNWNKQHSQEEGSELTICEELLYPVHGVFLVKKNFYGLEKMNEIIDALQSSGIIQHLMIQKVSFKSLSPLKQGPSALTIQQLAGVFEILVFGYLFAFVVGIFEVINIFYHKYF